MSILWWHKLEHPITPTRLISPPVTMRHVWNKYIQQRPFSLMVCDSSRSEGDGGEWNQLLDKRHLLSSSNFTVSFWDYFITCHDHWLKLILALSARRCVTCSWRELRDGSNSPPLKTLNGYYWAIWIIKFKLLQVFIGKLWAVSQYCPTRTVREPICGFLCQIK